MAELPKLPESLRRLHALRWKDLIQRYGFTGGHLKWHESPVRRREAAKPAFSLKPPPPTTLHHAGHSVTFIGSQGELVSYEKWRREQMAAWAARENDPAVIDSIAIAQTSELAKARFAGIVEDYLSMWAEASGDSDECASWLEELALLVAREVGDLWREREWHAAWFERACRKEVEQALMPLVEECNSRARRLEIEHLEKPHLRVRSLVVGDDLKLAVPFEGAGPAIGGVAPWGGLPDLQANQVKATESSGLVPAGSEGINWEDVEISFLSDERVQVTVGRQVETRNYAEMGFEDKRSGKPNQAWGLLRALAVERGIIRNSGRGSKDFIAAEKRIERTRGGLRRHFGISSDPIPRDPNGGYCCRFKIQCAPSFEK